MVAFAVTNAAAPSHAIMVGDAAGIGVRARSIVWVSIPSSFGVPLRRKAARP
jgi:hypothetical protein